MNIFKKFFGNNEQEQNTKDTELSSSASEVVEEKGTDEKPESKQTNSSTATSNASLTEDRDINEITTSTKPSEAPQSENNVKKVEASNASLEQSSSENSDTGNESNADSEENMNEMILKSFSCWESTFRHQQISSNSNIEFPRSTFSNPVTIRQVLEKLYPNISNSYTGRNYLSKFSEDVLSTGSSESLSDVLDVSPFAFAFKREGEHQLSVVDESVAISLEYKGENGTLNYIHLFVKLLGQTKHSVYARVTTMRPVEGKDDMLTSRSKSLPEFYSLVMVFDVLDPVDDMKFFEETLASTRKKMEANENLTPYETEVLNGMYGMHLPPYNYGYANWLYQNERYYDAYIIYQRVYNILQPNAHALDKDSKEVFVNTCYHMGLCLQRLGHLVKASYFLELAASGNREYTGAYVTILALLSHNRVCFFLNQVRSKAASSEAAKKEQIRLEALVSEAEKQYVAPDKYDASVETVGYMLNNLFDIAPANILGATINHVGDTDINPCVVNGEDAWNLNLYDLTDTVVYLRYSHAQWQINSEIDKSILCFDNAIILSVNPVVAEDGTSSVRVNVMIPNFCRDDEKRTLGLANLPQNSSFVMGTTRPSQSFNNKDLDEVYKSSEHLLESNRIFEAMQGFDFIHRVLKIEYTKATSTDEMEELFFAATYRLGFCLVELGANEKASYYLDWAQEGGKAEYAQEYVNCMCNINDVRALPIIQANLNNLVKPEEPEYQEAYEFHKSFLTRRLAYILVNRHMFDDAEKVLKNMLKDPRSKDFAERELICIKQLRANEE